MSSIVIWFLKALIVWSMKLGTLLVEKPEYNWEEE